MLNTCAELDGADADGGSSGSGGGDGGGVPRAALAWFGLGPEDVASYSDRRAAARVGAWALLLWWFDSCMRSTAWPVMLPAPYFRTPRSRYSWLKRSSIIIFIDVAIDRSRCCIYMYIYIYI